MTEEQKRDRIALAELVSAWKIFKKAVNENPKAFDEPNQDESSPVADSTRKLHEIAEFRNEAKAAQQFVQKTLEQQRGLEQQTRSRPRGEFPALPAQDEQ